MAGKVRLLERLLARIDEARPDVLLLTPAETDLLEAYLSTLPRRRVSFRRMQDENRTGLTTYRDELEADRQRRAHIRCTLQFNRGRHGSKGTTVSNALSELERNTPPVDRDNGQWISNKRAAGIEGLETRTLADYRNRGIVTADKRLGRDRDGRVWRRTGTPTSHPWYLRSTLKRGQ